MDRLDRFRRNLGRYQKKKLEVERKVNKRKVLLNFVLITGALWLFITYLK